MLWMIWSRGKYWISSGRIRSRPRLRYSFPRQTYRLLRHNRVRPPPPTRGRAPVPTMVHINHDMAPSTSRSSRTDDGSDAASAGGSEMTMMAGADRKRKTMVTRARLVLPTAEVVVICLPSPLSLLSGRVPGPC